MVNCYWVSNGFFWCFLKFGIDLQLWKQAVSPISVCEIALQLLTRCMSTNATMQFQLKGNCTMSFKLSVLQYSVDWQVSAGITGSWGFTFYIIDKDSYKYSICIHVHDFSSTGTPKWIFLKPTLDFIIFFSLSQSSISNLARSTMPWRRDRVLVIIPWLLCDPLHIPLSAGQQRWTCILWWLVWERVLNMHL